jgi:hypothetical protein
MTTKATLLIALLGGTAGSAWAQQTDPYEPGAPDEPETEVPDTDVDDPEVYAPVTVAPTMEAEEDQGMLADLGLGMWIGGGVNLFTDEDMRDFAGTGGNWNARLAIGTRQNIGLEAAYIGSAQSIDALGLDDDAILLGNGVEGALRLNFLAQESFQPFALAGLGWRRYTIENSDFNTSDVRDEDDIMEVPLGVGAAFKFAGLSLDARTMVRLATDNDLVISPTGDDDEQPDLHTWSAQVDLGWEF